MLRLVLILTLFLSTHAFATENVDLAEGVCADPNMTDEQRADLVARSRADAIRCMGEAWVEEGEDLIQPAAIGDLTIKADIARNQVVVIDRQGKERFFLTSPGLPGTPTINFKGHGPFRLEGPDYVVQDKDKDYVGAPMPWAFFFEGGYAFHGTYETKKLGRPASHGCLRLRIAHAEWLNKEAALANDASVKVHVFNAPEPIVVKKKPKRRRIAPRPEYAPEYGLDPYESPYQPRPFNGWF